MQISREQYNRFLNNQCSEEERLLFNSYLEQHPEVIEQWLQASDWETYESGLSLHPAFSAKMREKFLLYLQQRKKRYKLLYKISAAAIVSGLIAATAVWLFLSRQAEKTIVVETRAVPKTWQVISNQSDTVSKIILHDQSVVKLCAHSEIKFKERPDLDKREIFLEGTAHFTVTKDAARPFMVYTGTIATTALGTAFTVKTDVAGKTVAVKLHEGKVVVRRVDTSLTQALKDYYLLPGDELVANSVGNIEMRLIAKKPTKTNAKKNNPISKGTLSFSNAPLVDVLQHLSQQFNVAINYQAEELKSIFITASFSERDTVQGILDMICVLNNLRLQNTDGTFAISR